MKMLFYVAMFAAVLLTTSCASKKPDTPPAKPTQFCKNPEYQIILGEIQTHKDNILSKEEFMPILDVALAQSGCFDKVKKPTDNVYKLDIFYNLALLETKENTSLLSSKDSITLRGDMQFKLTHTSKSIEQNATSTLKLSEKKYLGIGQEVDISKEQKEDVIKRCLKTIFTNLSNMSKGA
ncbi:hypothetical protein [Helicobacter marmotae]|uniref:Uncharacterized protein n=1 Tax=Helicobacter marmotae TaxID=152490 RepID=A0A3D8I308_9HELI|nr:hypothetical protein [Helicobacter marmotae]RDU59498.1 hypothetical protein CQA63_06220 [Helicobacter marmotae]